MNYNLILGDCLIELKKISDNSVDSIVTDPPYGLGVVKDIQGLLQAWLSQDDTDEYISRTGFMSQEWDKCVPSPCVWRECLRVLKPGGHLLCFAGTRTQDLMGISIRIAGFELRDEISYLGNLLWTYSSGFPKSLNISKSIDKKACVARKVVGFQKHPTSLNGKRTGNKNSYQSNDKNMDGNFPITLPETENAKKYEGWGTALKPAHEPILMFRKPLSEKTITNNVLEHGTGGINIDACRITTNKDLEHNSTDQENINCDCFHNDSMGHRFISGNSLGRFPSNLILENNIEVINQFPYTQSGAMKKKVEAYSGESNTGFLRGESGPYNQYGDSGLASRFFYCAKTSTKDRNNNGICKNTHPTVKPTDLMRYLVKLVTPIGGVVLDPFMGSGSTGKACMFENFKFIGIEMNKEYFDIAEQRIEKTHK